MPLPESTDSHANSLEALGSIIETRCHLRKMERLLENTGSSDLPDLTAVKEQLQCALRESETVLSRVTWLFNDLRTHRDNPIDNPR